MNTLYPWAGACALALSLFGLTTPVHADTGPEPQQPSDEATQLEPLVITAPASDSALTVRLDPKAPQQPLPAADGAAFLKNIPGFSMTRKGGTDGEALFRGLGGSRLPMLMDGTEIAGGCSFRMDPPTAYLYPETFDEAIVIKGPQSVRYGNGNLAGLVLFETDDEPSPGPGAWGTALAGSWGRRDVAAGARWQGQRLGLRTDASHARQNDYEDGNGDLVHSQYERWNARAQVSWALDESWQAFASGELSDGEAAYADRMMDGVTFDREGGQAGLRYRPDGSGAVSAADVVLYRNRVDHVMDNYSLREVMPGSMYMVNNPDRVVAGARASVDWALSQNWALATGADWRDDRHRQRGGVSMMGAPDYASMPREDDMQASIAGLFAEVNWRQTDDRAWVGGLRGDRYQADNLQASGADAGKQHDEDLYSGFLRIEQQTGLGQIYAGYGVAERPADYWERISYHAFDLDAERNREIDLGWQWRQPRWRLHLNLFHSRIDDFILTRNDFTARNIDAERYGGEFELQRMLGDAWRLGAVISSVHGENRTDHTPLPQTPPLEGRLTLDWRRAQWTAGAVWRLVDDQDRIQPGYGNIIGQDLGSTPGFGSLSVNAGWQAAPQLRIAAGVDNLLDRAYAEHLSRAGASVQGYPVIGRINEPGRTLWLKLNWQWGSYAMDPA